MLFRGMAQNVLVSKGRNVRAFDLAKALKAVPLLHRSDDYSPHRKAQVGY